MTLLIYNSVKVGVVASTNFLLPNSYIPRPSLFLSPLHFRQERGSGLIASARKGLTSRTRRLEKRGKDRGGATTELDEEALGKETETRLNSSEFGSDVGGGGMVYSTGPPPEIFGEEQDFWEGPQWDALGFFIQYLWAFGILFGVIACGIAVATYNEGATDFKQTTVYKESIQSQELLEEPEASDINVFEGNPTEVAPSLE